MKYVTKSIKIILFVLVLGFIAILLLFGHSDIPLNELKAKYAKTTSSFISINGMDIHYVDEGLQTDSIPIILIHGTASSLHTFDSWADNLKSTTRVIRMDLPAYGLTGPFPNRDYSITHYTEFLNEFLNALKIKHCVLVGNSLGGQIAWNFTLEQPNKVTKLILIDAAGYPLTPKSVPIGFKAAHIPVVKNLLTFITPRFIVKESVEDVYFDKSKVTEQVVDRYFDLTLRAGNRQAFVDRINYTSHTSAFKNISKIKQPTLILWGANDLLIPIEHAQNFHKDLPNSTLAIIKNSGHIPMEESPIESLKSVIEFLKLN